MIRLRDFERRDNPTRAARPGLARPLFRCARRFGSASHGATPARVRVASTPPDH